MNLRKFVAPSAPAAMRLVRAALGPDAVILSNRQVGGQSEILALPGAEADRLAQRADDVAPVAAPRGAAKAPPAKVAAAKPAPVPKARPATPAAARPAAPAIPLAQWAPAISAAAAYAQDAEAYAADMSEAHASEPAPVASTLPVAKARPQPQPQPQPQALPQTQMQMQPQPRAQPAPAANAEVLGELARMKGLIEAQGATLAWMEARHRSPVRAQLMRELVASGFGEAFAREVTDRMPADLAVAAGRDWVRSTLARSLRCTDDLNAMVDRGGTFALVGPTGVGKTTSAAKLAARAVVRHGAQGVGLVSTDTYRIGAQDQLRIYARILGVPVHVCHDAPSLSGAMDALSDRRVVIVDTTGLSQRDPRVAAQNALLEACSVQRVLLLNAAMQSEALEETARAYGAREGFAAFTKLDEAVNLGGAIEAAIRHKLRLRFVTNGQRVPEDMHAANGAFLSHRALRARAERAEPNPAETVDA